MFLTGQIKDDDRDNCKNQSSHNSTHINTSIASLHILDRDRNCLIFVQIQYQIRKKEVIPDPHCLENTNRDVGRLHDRKYYTEKCTDRCAAIYHCCLLYLDWN